MVRRDLFSDAWLQQLEGDMIGELKGKNVNARMWIH